jgi:sporulation protein YlmC with PRC-barrel domain
MAMNLTRQDQVTEFIIGAEVVCNDGALGELRRVVVDPIDRSITHLVVEAPHRRGTGHLVPVALVGSATEAEISLRCSASDFAALDGAEEVQFLPGATGTWNYQQSQMMSLPYYPASVGLAGLGTGAGIIGMESAPHMVIHDRVPAGEVEVRRDEQVHATDGEIGRVQGLVVDPRDHAVTHVLLQEGHLWGKRRVSIPISAVTAIKDGIRLDLSKQQIEDLPAVALAEPV